ncbi:MAG: hypothetical protein ACK5KO_10435 [Arachnia sp.]
MGQQFAGHTMVLLLAVVALCLVVALEGWLIKKRPAWLGVILPAVIAITGAVCAATGLCIPLDGVVVVLGAGVLVLWWWSQAGSTAWRLSHSSAREATKAGH